MTVKEVLCERPSVENQCPYCFSKLKLVHLELNEYYCGNCDKYFTTGW